MVSSIFVEHHFMDFVVELIIEVKCLLKCKILSFATNLQLIFTESVKIDDNEYY